MSKAEVATVKDTNAATVTDEKIMVALQILCKCIAVGNINIIEDNQLTEEYFLGYEDERNFIVEHFKKYGNTPDTATLVSKFPDIDIVDVTESDRYLVDAIREEHLYSLSVPIVQKVAELLKTDANVAAQYMMHAVKDLHPTYDIGGTDIIAEASRRRDEFKEKKKHQDEWFFTTGFPELDDVIHGIQRHEEYIVLYARTNQGKTWVLAKIATHIWEIGYNIGYISPEMGANSIGYRFDTLHEHLDNKALVYGTDDVSDETYEAYIDKLQERTNKFLVASAKDFNGKITVSKLIQWKKEQNLDAIFIDGLTYLSDERAKRGDSKNDALTNISEDLMEFSRDEEIGIPIITVVQVNRTGIVDKDSDDLPELESVRDSDGINFNASKCIAIRQNKDGDLLMQIKKSRHGRVGTKIAYKWSPNIGEFINIPMGDDSRHESIERTERRERKKQSTVKEDVF